MLEESKNEGAWNNAALFLHSNEMCKGHFLRKLLTEQATTNKRDHAA